MAHFETLAAAGDEDFNELLQEPKKRSQMQPDTPIIAG